MSYVSLHIIIHCFSPLIAALFNQTMQILTVTLITIFILIVVAFIKDSKARKKFNIQYQEYLQNNEGLEVFCYTNRLKFCSIIETHLIPKIDKSVRIIKLEGKEPQTDLNKEFISYALHNIKEVGFPNIMKIVNGSLIDFSLHKTIYDCINNDNVEVIPKLINDKLNKLRSLE
ncbi:hypothetical protein ACPUVO_07870 [Pseudocolwellia sp. HL-MZ19]|uniref:hypothetical protein n=1 Tax=Pseudocolwellia sp. HL-MZ19 TaxID=3400846 RepID=UPI003CEDEBA7